jgi:hypothetical protein
VPAPDGVIDEQLVALLVAAADRHVDDLAARGAG